MAAEATHRFLITISGTFATARIKSGVDLPAVSRWLGHKDGGVLALRVYGHLRQEHSIELALKVAF